MQTYIDLDKVQALAISFWGDLWNSDRIYYLAGFIYLVVLLTVYKYGKKYRIKLSKVIDELKKSRGAVAKIQKKVSLINHYRRWTKFAYWSFIIILLIAIVADAYLRIPKHKSWNAAFVVVIKEYDTILKIAGALVIVLILISYSLNRWMKNLSTQQLSAVSEQVGFVDRLLKTLDPPIVYALYHNVDKENIRASLQKLQSSIQHKADECNEREKEIDTKRDLIDSYVDFLRGVAEMDWCEDCIRALTTKQEIPSMQELEQTQEVDQNNGFHRQDSLVLVCKSNCLQRCQKFLKEFERKLKEEVERITTHHDTRVDTYRTEETEADLQEFGITKHY